MMIRQLRTCHVVEVILAPIPAHPYPCSSFSFPFRVAGFLAVCWVGLSLAIAAAAVAVVEHNTTTTTSSWRSSCFLRPAFHSRLHIARERLYIFRLLFLDFLFNRFFFSVFFFLFLFSSLLRGYQEFLRPSQRE
jgi:hypothetical protein